MRIQRAGERIQYIGLGDAVRYVAPRAAAAVPWWLSGGILAAQCRAAYQPKGAASYAASKVNLNQPGTNDAIDGAAFPSWAAGTGWTFSTVLLQYLDTTVLHDDAGQVWSMLVQVTGAGSGVVAGDLRASRQFGIFADTGAATHRYHNSGVSTVAGAVAAGNLAIAGAQGYLNGIVDGGAIGVAAQQSSNIYIGAGNNNPAPYFCFTGTVVAVSIYSVTITAPQVAAVAAAMAAL